MTKIELLEYRSRAIIGNIRNVSRDCIKYQGTRVQYMHFWRDTKKKLYEVLKEKELLSDQYRTLLESLKVVLDKYPKPQNSQSLEISTDCMNILGPLEIL